MSTIPGKHRNPWQSSDPTARKQVVETCPALPFGPAQYRGGAGAFGRNPASTTKRFTGCRTSCSRRIFRAHSPEGLPACARPYPRRQACDAGHAEDFSRCQTWTSAASPSANTSRDLPRSHDDHQRRGLWPYGLRSVGPSRADPGWRGHGECRLRRVLSTFPRATRSKMPSASSMS